MNAGITLRDNPVASYFSSKGMWLFYIIITSLVHLCLLSFPFITMATAWTLTAISHDIIMFLVLHVEKGAPFETDQGSERQLTTWEQFDDGVQFTSTKKFLTVVPIVLFMLASFYTKYDPIHFVINAFSLIIIGLIPKLPMMYKRRLFGINKY